MHGILKPCRAARQARFSCYNPRAFADAQVAQLVEQRTENPRVGGSIPPLGTIDFLNRDYLCDIMLLSCCNGPSVTFKSFC